MTVAASTATKKYFFDKVSTTAATIRRGNSSIVFEKKVNTLYMKILQQPFFHKPIFCKYMSKQLLTGVCHKILRSLRDM